ncbi:MAG: hypothetical protein LH624_12440, partial [Cryobacterium sp.]|nr:hypothetical protein [Cryobacterium sp.]
TGSIPVSPTTFSLLQSRFAQTEIELGNSRSTRSGQTWPLLFRFWRVFGKRLDARPGLASMIRSIESASDGGGHADHLGLW